MTNTTWDTDETSRIIMNDEGLYNRAMELSRDVYSIGRLAFLMEQEFTEILTYSDVDLDRVVWEEIAAELMED